jgi:hypothetical protein
MRRLSTKKKQKDGDHHEFVNPCYGSDFTDDELKPPVTNVPDIVTEVHVVDIDQSDAKEGCAEDIQG